MGKVVQRKKKLVDLKQHRIVECVHPSRNSAYSGFWGSKQFSKCNALLREMDKEEIDLEIN